LKSHERDQVKLAICVYKDAIAKCVAVQPALRDEMTISSRVEREGLSFLTITLPSYCKDFERSLAVGHIDPTLFKSFKKRGSIPAFLQGMISQVFDQGTGRILNESIISIPAIESIRLFSAAFKKLEIDCTPARVRKTMDTFTEIEDDLSVADVSEPRLRRFIDVADIVWDCLRDLDITQSSPRHGPGATEEHISGNRKYTWRYWYDRIEPYFPLLDNAYTIGCYPSKELDNVTIVSLDKERPVRVVPVPKTMKGPRVIAIEPCCMQFVQQAIRRELYARIESSRFSKGHVNFTDQSINRELALAQSKEGRLATIDLSEASDRVLNSVATRMFDCNPDLQDAIQACRSTHAEIDGRPIIGPLKKFASMGSALCFPVESMYFYTICIAALLERRDLPVSSRNVFNVSRDVYVYGDDILVPSTEATFVIGYLQEYHCKVNMSKSFWTGKFRESCGMDAYDGVCVTPTYIRQLRPESKRQAKQLVSWVKTANFFEKRGCVLTSAYMFNVCERLLGSLPNVSETSSALGRTHGYGDVPSGRWNKDLQRLEIKAYVASPVYFTDELAGYGALRKCLDLSGSRVYQFGRPLISIDEKHLQRSARHGTVTLKRRWVSAN